jgi:hypothetical protein
LLLDTPVAVGIELDHQVLLLDTPVAVTRGMLISWVPLRRFDGSPPMGTVLTVDRLSFSRSGLQTFADVHPWFADVCRRLQTFTHGLQTFADVHPWFAHCRRWKLDHQVLLDTMVAVTRGILPGHRAPPVAGGIELDHQVLLDTMVAVTRGMLPGHRAPTVAGGIELDHQVLLLLDTPVAVTRGILPGHRAPTVAVTRGMLPGH